MDLQAAVDVLQWRNVPAKAVALAEKCAASVCDIRRAIRDLPTDGFLSLWLNHKQDALLLNCGDWMEQDDIDKWDAVLSDLASDLRIEAEIGTRALQENTDWVKVAERDTVARAFLERQAESPTLSGLGKLTGFKEGIIPGAPNPMISTLAGGLLGAGLGYGGGYLAERLLPEKWEKNRLRRTMAVLGGLAGAAPGALWSAARLRQGKSLLESYPDPSEAGGLQAGLMKASRFIDDGFSEPWPVLDVPEFQRTLWEDERVTRRLPPPTRAAASGLAQGASAINNGTRWVTPMDMARMTAGMGSGYLSGALIGKTLGLLTGMPESTQNTLKNTGVWAGIVANMVPLAFGGR